VQLKTLYTLFCLAVFMFIAKPFIGFSLGEFENHGIESHRILAKSFAKRKPEDLEDAKIKAAEIKQKLSNPPETIFLTIAAILGLFFPIVFKRSPLAVQSFLDDIKASLRPVEHQYLLNGKLTI